MRQCLLGLNCLPQRWNRSSLSLSASLCRFTVSSSPMSSSSLSSSVVLTPNFRNESRPLITLTSRRCMSTKVLSSSIMNNNRRSTHKGNSIMKERHDIKRIVNNGVSSCPSSSCSTKTPQTDYTSATSLTTNEDNHHDNNNKSKNTDEVIDDLLSSRGVPVNNANKDTSKEDIGLEITGRKISKTDIMKILSIFVQRKQIRVLAAEHGLRSKLFIDVFASFRKEVLESKVLDPELHIILDDIMQNHGHPDDLFPHFLKYAKKMYPHIDCLEDLKKISDLRLPPNWYPLARNMNRKFILHCGPTNSGKTWNAMKSFLDSKTGLYCGPLKMLAVEIYQKANNSGVDCDLITGEERRYSKGNDTPSNHVSCTVEMSSVTQEFDVAVIDEIQMLRCPERGWAWTRALLGLAAKEIHLCGEKASTSLIMELLSTTGEHLEVIEYDRLTKLKIEDKALESLKNVQPGDCIVCFSKREIYNISLQLERMGHNVATIYGTLPPAAKLLQCNRFNDPNDPCNIMVATDAIGMGLNLSIKRIIFQSIIKPMYNNKNERTMDIISPPQALQIAGRAGRFGTSYEEGFVTTLKSDDLPILKKSLSTFIDDIEAAGLHPTVDQIEMFSYLLPNATLSNILDIFVTLCQMNRHYFMCNIENVKYLADILEHIPLQLRAKYTFCCAPVDSKNNFLCAMLLKYARQFSKQQPMTVNWLCNSLQFPWQKAKNITELDHLLSIYDSIDLYLWFSYRFPDVFLDQDLVRDIQRKLDQVICECVSNITKLIQASGNMGYSSRKYKNLADNKLNK